MNTRFLASERMVVLISNGELVLSVSDLAAELKISRQRFYELMRRKKIPRPRRIAGFRRKGWTQSEALMIVAKRRAQLVLWKAQLPV